jgi:hypothetical protein
MSKEVKVEVERDWEVEEAMETLKRYAKLVEDKKLKDEAIKKLEEEASKYKEVAKDLKD